MRDIELSDQSIATKVNLTPLIDVVFILLIFFVVTSSFVKEAGIEVNRPNAQSGASQEKATIMVAISEGNEIWINQQKVDLQAVRSQVERLHAESPESGVVIQADTESTTGIAIEVLDQVRLAGVSNVAFAINRPK